MDISITRLTPTDYHLLAELLDVYKETFGLTDFRQPPTDYLKTLLHHPTMLFLVDHCTRSGIKEIFVQADRPDQHAAEFYKKNGGTPEDVIHFSFDVPISGSRPETTAG